VRDLDTLLNKDIHNITKKDRSMLDLDPSDEAVMSIWELQCTVFELKSAKAQDKVVSERTGGQIKDFIEYCGCPGFVSQQVMSLEMTGT
jgi:hypothetical protein